jgi:lipoate-protein ligase A
MITVGDAGSEQQRCRASLDAGVTQPRLVTWRYDSPAVVLGRGQPGSAELLARAERERLAVVSRASGGGAVMAGPWMLSVTLLLPAVHPLARASLPAGYRAVGESCRRALQRVRVPAESARDPAAIAVAPPAPGDAVHWACFGNLSHGELEAPGGGKILGIAQVRRRDAIAVCIGVLLGRPDWETLVRVWCGRDDPGIVHELERRTASCDRFVPVGGTAFVESLAAALAAELPAPGLAA